MKQHHPIITCPPMHEETRLTTLALAQAMVYQIKTSIAHVEAQTATHVFTLANGMTPKADWLAHEQEVLAFWNERVQKMEEAGS